MPTYKAVIFDLDSTLYDKSGLAWRLIKSQLRQGKLRMLRKERSIRKKLMGKHFCNEQEFSTAFFAEFRNPKAKEWFYQCYLPDMVAILQQHYTIAPWVEETMANLRASGCKIAVFSDYECVREKLQAIGFDLNWADCLFEAPALGGLKPCKESFEKVCQAMQLQPSECLMVGDREDTDGDGAGSVGMAFSEVSHFIATMHNGK